MTFNQESFDQFKARVHYVTAHRDEIHEKGLAFFRDDVVPEGLDASTIEKADKLKETLNKASFGCQQDNVARLFEIAIGVPAGHLQGRGEYHLFQQSSKFMPYMGFVPLTCLNGHNYPIGTFNLVRESNSACNRIGGDTGNRMSSEPESYRLMTPEEIEAMFHVWSLTLRRGGTEEEPQYYLSNAPRDFLSDSDVALIDEGIAHFAALAEAE